MVNKLDKLKLTDIEKINLFFALGKAYEDEMLKNSFYYLNKASISKKKYPNIILKKIFIFLKH